jgi:hypothetical protein
MRRSVIVTLGSALAMLCAAGARADVAPPGQPIAHAGLWRLMGPADPAPCSARLEGSEIDTVLLINKNGDLVLMGGRGDWQLDASDATVTLQIDKLPPADVKAEFVTNLVLAPITDSGLLGRLRRAHQLGWTLPVGHFAADVTGLGAALDAAKACYRRVAAANAASAAKGSAAP